MFGVIFDAIFSLLSKPVNIVLGAVFSLLSKPITAVLEFISNALFDGALLAIFRKNRESKKDSEENKEISTGRRIVKNAISVIFIIACIAALWYQIGPGKPSDPWEKIPKLEDLKEGVEEGRLKQKFTEFIDEKSNKD